MAGRNKEIMMNIIRNEPLNMIPDSMMLSTFLQYERDNRVSILLQNETHQDVQSDNNPQVIDMSDIAIRIRDLRKSYAGLEAVRGINLDIRKGEIFGLIGPDGAGKTSVFQILG